MGIIRKICEKISKTDELRDEIEKLEKEVRNRDIILQRIKIVATCNHYGASPKDEAYREEHLLNYKTKKIYELACEFDKNDDIVFWNDIGELEE